MRRLIMSRLIRIYAVYYSVLYLRATISVAMDASNYGAGRIYVSNLGLKEVTFYFWAEYLL